MVFSTVGPRPVSLIALCALFATIGTGCVPPGSEQFNKPVASAAATSDPVILNGAGGKIETAAKIDAKGGAPAGSAEATATDPAATGAAKADAGAAPGAGPVLAAKPLPPVPETP